jgi:hypothetical protein
VIPVEMNSSALFCVCRCIVFQTIRQIHTWDRCYDYLNIFAEKFGKKIGVFGSKQSQIIQNFDHNIGFLEKRQFFRRKFAKSQKLVIITSTPGDQGDRMIL